jgi:hypothetical protein
MCCIIQKWSLHFFLISCMHSIPTFPANKNHFFVIDFFQSDLDLKRNSTNNLKMAEQSWADYIKEWCIGTQCWAAGVLYTVSTTIIL